MSHFRTHLSRLLETISRRRDGPAKKNGYAGPVSALDAHAATLETYFKDHPPRTVAEAQQAIKTQTGIERSPTQVQAFMKRLGMKCRKVGYVPGQAANPDKQLEQETFKTQELA